MKTLKCVASGFHRIITYLPRRAFSLSPPLNSTHLHQPELSAIYSSIMQMRRKLEEAVAKGICIRGGDTFRTRPATSQPNTFCESSSSFEECFFEGVKSTKHFEGPQQMEARDRDDATLFHLHRNKTSERKTPTPEHN
ncbi:hypothetical protein GE061_009246 [Apolygus lucorum]|uniref:Uncharacterized protein n=1 Tax=Apolygus lucorum TaxID=248454 RepID=A0A8S9Y003_APOLU|nr:hypothetical protein GE061_009246 [Apolygus lucorum]